LVVYHSKHAFASSAAFSIGGSSLPRAFARRKIPAQALGDKEYFGGAPSSKIRDSQQAFSSLWHSVMLSVLADPSEINASPSNHSGVCPFAGSRHWNFGFTERLDDGFITTPPVNAKDAGDVLKDRDFGVVAIGGAPHFFYDSDGFKEKPGFSGERSSRPGDAELLVIPTSE
jgi:hypothetical protein